MWDARDRVACAGLTALVLGSLPLLVHSWYDPINDAAVYLLTARALRAGEGYTLFGEPFALRPPGFSLFLLPWVGGDFDFRTLNWLLSLCGAAGVLLLFFHARPRLGGALAAVACAGLWLNPGYQRLCNQTMSDLPGTALLLGCLLLARASGPAAPLRREVALGLLVGVAASFRSIHLLLVPAIFASRWLLERPGGDRRSLAQFGARRGAVFALTALALLAPWAVRNQRVELPSPADQTRARDYATAMWHTDPGDPTSPRLAAADVLARAERRGRQIAAVLGSQLRESEWSRGRAVVALALIGCLAIVALRRREPAELFALSALALLSVYFSFVPRLVLPVYALALPAAAELLRDALVRVLAPRAAAVVAPVALGLVLAANAEPRRDWPAIEARHRELQARSAVLAEAVGPDAPLASAHGPHYAVLLGRPVYSLRFAAARQGVAAGVENVLARYEVDAVALAPEEKWDGRLRAYLEEAHGPAEDLGPMLLFRVRR